MIIPLTSLPTHSATATPLLASWVRSSVWRLVAASTSPAPALATSAATIAAPPQQLLKVLRCGALSPHSCTVTRPPASGSQLRTSSCSGLPAADLSLARSRLDSWPGCTRTPSPAQLAATGRLYSWVSSCGSWAASWEREAATQLQLAGPRARPR